VLAGDAEALVEDVYRRVQLPPSWVEKLTEELEAEIVDRQAEASANRVVLTKKLAKLADERQKLLQAFYANAIPLELLKTEQDRVTAAEQTAKAEVEVTEDDLAGWQNVLSMAIQLAGNCRAAYLKGAPPRPSSIQRGGSRGRLREGSEDCSGRVLPGVRTSLLSPEFE